MTEEERTHGPEQAPQTPPAPPGQTGPEPDAQSGQDEPLDLERAHPADAADHLENLPLVEQVQVIQDMALDDAAESIVEMESPERTELLKELPPDYAADLLENMSPDDAADILDELDSEHQTRLLKRVEAGDAHEIRNLMTFDPDTAGGVMNTEVVVLDQGLTADQAISFIRKSIEESEIPYYGYVVDENDRLVGVLSLRNLILAKPGKILSDLIADQTLIAATHDMDQEEVAQLLERYNFLALPVTDHDGRLLGVVTHDDVIDIIHEEASEDMLGMVGAGHDETTDTPWLKSVAMRLPWLLVNVANSAIAAWVVHLFEGTITEMAVLAALMPIVANQAGNAGQQSLAVMIRQLAVERFDRRKAWLAVLREAKVGMINGLFIALVVIGGVFLLTHSTSLAVIFALALGLDMIIGNTVGAAIPLVLRELGRDPAQASSIFLTTITDSCGFFIFLGLATIFLL